MLVPKIIFESDNFLVLDKPAGLTVNRSRTTINEKTLQDWLEENFNFQDREKKSESFPSKTSSEDDFYKRTGIIHRLDKDTSGLILVAKNLSAFQNLQRQFKERTVKKTYLALVWGRLASAGEIKAPITRNPFNRGKFGVFLGGREALTSYKVLKNVLCEGHDFTLLEVTPLTGRTHQIRVHLHYIDHPLAGDPLYSGRKHFLLGLKLFGRLMLHAYKISFKDPQVDKVLEFISPIPYEFKKFV